MNNDESSSWLAYEDTNQTVFVWCATSMFLEQIRPTALLLENCPEKVSNQRNNFHDKNQEFADSADGECGYPFILRRNGRKSDGDSEIA